MLMRRPTVLLLAALAACGPASPAGESATNGGTGGPTFQLAPDQQLCVDYCLNLDARSFHCTWADFTCYDFCKGGLEYQDMAGCGAQMRAERACEAQATDFDAKLFCETAQCLPQYAASELCRGYCYHLDGQPGGGANQTECQWWTSCYGGHEFEMVCQATASPSCSCKIDGAEVGTCQLAVGLSPFACEAVDVFTGCCTDLFAEVLQPAPVEDTTGGGGGGGGDPVGASCPLRGLYVDCEVDGAKGRSFCDESAGGLKFGACVLQPECELAGSAYCEKRCELIDGAPTWVAIDECSTDTI
jgi:hypothetical protein